MDIWSARTSRAPIQSTPTTPAKTRKITMAVISARTPIRRRAATKLFSVTSWNRARLRPSWVKACTVCADKSPSEALPDEAAIQS